MKILLSALALAAMLGIAPATATASSSQTDCLHRNDFRSIERTVLSDVPADRWRVEQAFGTKGKSAGRHTQVYQGCAAGSRAWVQFRRDNEGTARVVSTAYTARYFGGK